MKQVKYLLRGKRYNTWIDTGGPREREKVIELHPPSVWIAFLGHFLLDFLWPVILIFLLHSPCLAHLRILPHVCVHLFSQDGFYPLTSLPFGLRGALLRVCCLGRLLTLTTRNLWSRQGPAFSLNCPASLVMEFRSAGNESPIALLWRGWVGGEGLLIYLLSQCPVIWIKLWIKFVHEQETKNVWKQIRNLYFNRHLYFLQTIKP